MMIYLRFETAPTIILKLIIEICWKIPIVCCFQKLDFAIFLNLIYSDLWFINFIRIKWYFKFKVIMIYTFAMKKDW